jgi:hypothetical protein
MSTSVKVTKLTNPKKHPSDLTITIILGSKKAPYVVRVEIGTINRGFTRLLSSMIRQRPGQMPMNPTTVGTAGGVYIEFGGCCGVGHNKGSMGDFGGGGPGGANTSVLAKGYATLNSSLLAYSTSENDTPVAKTAMMLKEHFIKHYGVPIYTIGSGGSGDRRRLE